MKKDIYNSPQTKKAYKTPVLKLHGTVSKITKMAKQGSELDNGEFSWSPE
jgi:hypothetical protein